MSDQDIKPVEGFMSPVEKLEVDVDDSTTAPEVPETNGKDKVEIKVEHSEETKGDDKDAVQDAAEDAVQDAVEDAVQDATEDAVQDATEVKDGESTGAAEAPGDDDDKEAKVQSKKRKWPQIRYPPKGMLKVNRGGCPTREKSDPSILPDSDDPKAIRWQVEFYFSDSNLPSDKFLWNKTDGSNNKPVPLSLICSFSRMRRFKPYSAVVDALKTSSRLVLEGPEGEETVHRKEPCEPSDEMTRKIEYRTTYIKGFGEESKSTQFDVEDFLSQFGEINAVRLRRDEKDKEKKPFKGSIFVEWVDEETGKKFYDLDPEPRWKDNPLMIMPKLEYERQSEEEERRKGTFQNNGQRQNGHRGGRAGRGHRESRGNRQGHDSDNWKKRRDDDQREGFNDRRGRRDHRGRGRGNGRGRGRDRGQNGNDRANEQQSAPRDDGRPKIHTSKEGQKIVKEEQAKRDSEVKTNGKRGRDEDSTTDAPPAKKVDAKEAVANTA
ncbi:hypothetical protein F4781DRAFT_250955 [Annulohypoxylon bovei var. microspora]|nr:hypothetical protein F4781DRAFT_250955 [Annulohypoxylon bovei var. microspora]